jgi:hypothetical protein
MMYYELFFFGFQVENIILRLYRPFSSYFFSPGLFVAFVASRLFLAAFVPAAVA